MAQAQTTLNGALNNSQTNVVVRDVLGFASSLDTDDVVQIDSEFMRVTAGLGTTSWTVTRAYASSTAASHLDGATVSRIARSWTDLTRIKTRTSILTSDTTDDAVLAQIIAAVNAEITRLVTNFLGPATDLVRAYDGYDSRAGGRRLYISGGIRTLTQVRIATQTGGSFTVATLSDYLLRPSAWNLRTGQPYSYVQCTDVPTGNFPYFLPGFANIELTGTFGYAAPPDDLCALADALVVRMWKARDQGMDSPYPFLTDPELVKLDDYRREQDTGV